ncbi:MULTISPECIES: hypothetical protein [unclassified Methylobacterium]|uniref:hypothetical protein n=1 Tax=unclassified Methylobacterium TaxID=2615210 RepID=UPI00226AAE63|nr:MULTISPECIES: hypothetical protein [unclassified Methylobacterium]
MHDAIDRNSVVEDAMEDEERPEYEDPDVWRNLRRGSSHHGLPAKGLTPGAQLRDEAAGTGWIVGGDEITNLARVRPGSPRHHDRRQGLAFSRAP